MITRLLAVGLFVAAVAGVLAVSDPAAAAAPAASKAKVKKAANKKAAAKKKPQPLDTVALFQKLDANADKQLDPAEFTKLFSVQPEPKGKKGAPLGPFDLEFTFKSLDADGDKLLSVDEFKGIVPAVFPARKK